MTAATANSIDNKTDNKPTGERCCKQVSSIGMGFNFHQCLRSAVVTRNNKPYCKQHDPEQVKQRNAARQAKWDAERQANEEKWQRQGKRNQLLSEIAEVLSKRPKFIGPATTMFERYYVDWSNKADKLLKQLKD